MLDKITARSGLLLDRTSQLPWGRLIAVSDWATAYRYLAIIGAFSLLGAVLVWPIFGPDYPPGVDTATFLHLSWVTKLAASGQLANPLVDPYWYGGFQYLVSYPPLGYGLVGIISFLTRLDLVWVYTALLVISYGAVAAATYWLATELGLRRWSAALAGTLVALAYPVLSAVFLWGWFTSVLALPLGLASIMLLERSLRTGNWRPALWGAICMALSILVHHMTGLALGLGLIAWFVYHLIAGIYSRRQVVAFSALFVAITALLVAPWGIPFMVHALGVGFRREVPGTMGAGRGNVQYQHSGLFAHWSPYLSLLPGYHPYAPGHWRDGVCLAGAATACGTGHHAPCAGVVQYGRRCQPVDSRLSLQWAGYRPVSSVHGTLDGLAGRAPG